MIGSNERSIMETIHKEFYFQSERRNLTSLQLWELISNTLKLSKRSIEYIAKQETNRKEETSVANNHNEEQMPKKPRVVVLGKGQKLVKLHKRKPPMKPDNKGVKVEVKDPASDKGGTKDEPGETQLVSHAVTIPPKVKKVIIPTATKKTEEVKTSINQEVVKPLNQSQKEEEVKQRIDKLISQNHAIVANFFDEDAMDDRALTANGGFKCPICKKIFKEVALRNDHLKTVHNYFKKCPICSLTLPTLVELSKHIRTHYIGCSQCSFVGRELQKVHEHIAEKHPQAEANETQSNKPQIDKPEIDNPLKVNDGFKCSQSEETFKEIAERNEHLRAVHIKFVKCPMCSYTCFNASVLSNHIKSHHKSCTLCSYVGRDTQVLLGHFKEKHTNVDYMEPMKEAESRDIPSPNQIKKTPCYAPQDSVGKEVNVPNVFEYLNQDANLNSGQMSAPNSENPHELGGKDPLLSEAPSGCDNVTNEDTKNNKPVLPKFCPILPKAPKQEQNKKVVRFATTPKTTPIIDQSKLKVVGYHKSHTLPNIIKRTNAQKSDNSKTGGQWVEGLGPKEPPTKKPKVMVLSKKAMANMMKSAIPGKPNAQGKMDKDLNSNSGVAPGKKVFKYEMSKHHQPMMTPESPPRVLPPEETKDKDGLFKENLNPFVKVYGGKKRGESNPNRQNDLEAVNVNKSEVSQNVTTVPPPNNVPAKKCCWGDCTTKSENLQPGLFWVPFPKPNLSLRMAKEWAQLCGMEWSNIKDGTFICSLHFPYGALLDYT